MYDQEQRYVWKGNVHFTGSPPDCSSGVWSTSKEHHLSNLYNRRPCCYSERLKKIVIARSAATRQSYKIASLRSQ